MDYKFSKHASEQAKLRNISKDTVKNILGNPGQKKKEGDHDGLSEHPL